MGSIVWAFEVLAQPAMILTEFIRQHAGHAHERVELPTLQFGQSRMPKEMISIVLICVTCQPDRVFQGNYDDLPLCFLDEAVPLNETV